MTDWPVPFQKMARAVGVNLRDVDDALLAASGPGSKDAVAREMRALGHEIRQGLHIEALADCTDRSHENAVALSQMERVRALVGRFVELRDRQSRDWWRYLNRSEWEVVKA